MTFPSLRARLTAAFALSSAVLMAFACCGLIGYGYYAAARNEDRTLQEAAARLHAEWQDGEDRGNLGAVLREDAAELQAAGIVASMCGAGGTTRISSVPAGSGKMPAAPPCLPLGAHHSSDGFWRTRVEQFGENRVVLALPWEERDGASLRKQAMGLILLSVFVVATGAAGAWRTVGRTLRPIALLSQQAQNAARTGDSRISPFMAPSLPLQLSAPSPDREVTELVVMLNAFLTRAAEGAAGRARFYAAASHELRTPLQGLSGHLELALSRSTRTETEYRAAIVEALTQTRRLSALTHDLLLLNRLGTESVPPAAEPVDLRALCARTIEAFGLQAQERGLRLDLNAGDTPMVIASPPSHAAILVRNLLENAVRYASPNGQINISLRQLPSGGGCELLVFNSFDAAIVLETARLFEPFYRPDASRTDETGGVGLGLALCQAVAAANGWIITLIQSEGVEARVRFPAPSAALTTP